MNKQRETTSRPQQVRNHWQKVKETETKPWQFILPVVLFIGSLILVSGIAGTIKNTFVFIGLLVLLMPLTAALIDVIRGNIRLRFKIVATAFLGYFIKILLQLMILVLSIPLLALMFIAGPVLALVFFVSLVSLVFYFIEIILKIDIKGVTANITHLEALLFLGGLSISLAVFFNWNRLEKLIHFAIDKIADVYIFAVKLTRRYLENEKL